MKVIFLDIDYVLNYPGSKSKLNDVLFVEDEKIGLLKQIIDKTGAKLVLSSTWRQGWFDLDYGLNTRDSIDFIALKEKFKEFGLSFISRTPIMKDMRLRGWEINSWLRHWGGEAIESFVILDDLEEDYLEPFAEKLVQTSISDGLLQEHVFQAIEILNIKWDGVTYE